MRRIFLLLSISIFLTLIHYSTGAPRKVRSFENDEFDNMVKKIVHKLKPYVDVDSMDESDDDDNNDEINEEKKKKIINNVQFTEKSEESNSDSNEQDEDNERDKQAILSHFIGVDHDKVSENSGEK